MAGVLLAAGTSSRFGAESKQLLEYDGRPMVRLVAEKAISAGLDPLIVVLGADASRVRTALTGLTPAPIVVENPGFASGPGTSIAVGVRACPPDVDAVAILVADQPLITPDLIRAVIAEWRAGTGLIARPTSGTIVGHPVLFDRRYLAELAELADLSGDDGGRTVIEHHPDCVRHVEVDDPTTLLDVDTPDDYALLRRNVNDTH